MERSAWPRRRVVGVILLAAGIVVALAGAAVTWMAWTRYDAAESVATVARADLDAALLEARTIADEVIVLQDEAVVLREFAQGQADCLRLNPWSPLCNNWSAESNLAAAEHQLAALEVQLDAAFARTAEADAPFEAARAEADAAHTALLTTGIGSAILAVGLVTTGALLARRSATSRTDPAAAPAADPKAQPTPVG